MLSLLVLLSCPSEATASAPDEVEGRRIVAMAHGGGSEDDALCGRLVEGGPRGVTRGGPRPAAGWQTAALEEAALHVVAARSPLDLSR